METSFADPVLLILAAFSRYEAALDWTRDRAIEHWGPIALQSDRFDFTETDYYQQAMGAGLKKTFFAFERPIDPATLPDLKRQAGEWELEYATRSGHEEPRPLNLDPGYITLAKLVLASTKDHAHRVYLREGIYAEVTLHFHSGAWRSSPWTYPDYQRADFQAFFTRCREFVKMKRRGN